MESAATRWPSVKGLEDVVQSDIIWGEAEASYQHSTSGKEAPGLTTILPGTLIFELMRPSSPSRMLAFVFLLLGAFTAPVSGLTHGLAHDREAHHRSAHEAAEFLLDAAHQLFGLETTDDHSVHDDIHVDGSVPPRAELLSVLPLEPVQIPVAREAFVPRAEWLITAALPRADPDGGPPPRLRAPPRA